MGDSTKSSTDEQILGYLQNLEERIARIESHLGLQAAPETENEDEQPQAIAAEDDDELELQLGQNWFAKAGIVGLALGIAFLLTLPYTALPPALPSLFGYALVGGIFFLSRYWRESFNQVSRYLLAGGLLLLYFTTLRLSYFTPAPALTSAPIELGLLLLVVVVNLVVAIRRRSVYLTALTLVLGYLTVLLGGGTYFVLIFLIVLASASSYLSVKFRWNGLLTTGIVLTYLTHLLWSANNPLFGNELQFGVVPHIHLIFLLLEAAILAAGTLLRAGGTAETAPIIVNSALNSLGAFSLFVISTLAATDLNLILWYAAASAVLLMVAVMFWVREKSVYATFVYAMLGYGALSAAIIAEFPMPEFFVWLSWQSILVLSTAVWFRSRFIVVANFGIYLGLFIAYLVTAATVSFVSASFGIVALLSARILNWQKDRLILHTELMRNAYLASALLLLPYALYHSVPPHLVSVSWLVLAAFYYGASRLLKLRKYRWMALLTMSLTILYVFIVDLTTIDPLVRIVSFLVVGSALLAISMFYSKKKRQEKKG